MTTEFVIVGLKAFGIGLVCGFIAISFVIFIYKAIQFLKRY
jgi:hypothetical protein